MKMKTLISLIFAMSLVSNSVVAQFSENFDQNTTNLSGNCWQLVQINHTTTSGDVINGTGSAFTNPPTSTSGTRSIATPFLNMTSTSLSVSFKYKTSSKIAGNATRTITIGITDKNGNFTALQTITMDKNSPTTVLTHSNTYTIPATGVYRLELRLGGATGDGNSRLIFDDLNVSASAYYGPTNNCNPAGTAVNDTYAPAAIAPYSENVKTNDQFPADGEVYNAFVVTAPTSGTLVLNADGSFTYTPDPLFTGGTITFTYALVDNGYTPATSNTATVTLNFPLPVVLAVELTDFKARATGSAVELKWWVENNFDGDKYDVQRSADGQNFETIAVVGATNHTSVYSAVDASPLSVGYYRLKIINKDATISYSKTIMFKKSDAKGAIKVLGNPATQQLRYSINDLSSGSVTVNVFTAAGQQVYSGMSNNTAVNSINIQHLRPGTYILVVTKGAVREAAGFVKQ